MLSLHRPEARLLDIKKEQIFYGTPFGPAQNGANAGLVSIAITLKPAAAEVRVSSLVTCGGGRWRQGAGKEMTEKAKEGWKWEREG